MGDHLLMIDCGTSGDGEDIDDILEGLRSCSYRANHLNSFILSHYHVDHYSGIILAAKENVPFTTGIEQVYFPRIPDFTDQKEFLTCLFAMNLRTLSSETGVMEYDFLNAISKLCSKSCQYRLLVEGDEIESDGGRIKVIWPPRVLSGARGISAVSKAISKFRSLMELDERTRALYDRVRRENLVGKLLEGEPFPSSDESHEDRSIDWQPDSEDRQLRGAIKNADSALREAANHMSLSFYEYDRLLFLGDLESNEIKKVASMLLKRGKMHFDVLIAAHHGTHWNDSLYQFRCHYCIASAGWRRFPHLHSGYKVISKHYLSTHVVGNIDLPSFLQGCHQCW